MNEIFKGIRILGLISIATGFISFFMGDTTWAFFQQFGILLYFISELILYSRSDD